jgi:hypothetical protein
MSTELKTPVIPAGALAKRLQQLTIDAIESGRPPSTSHPVASKRKIINACIRCRLLLPPLLEPLLFFFVHYSDLSSPSWRAVYV